MVTWILTGSPDNFATRALLDERLHAAAGPTARPG